MVLISRSYALGPPGTQQCCHPPQSPWGFHPNWSWLPAAPSSSGFAWSQSSAASWSHRSHRRGEGRVQRPGMSRGNGGQRWYKFAKADVHSAVAPGLLTLPSETFSCTHGEDDRSCRFFESLTTFLKCQRFHCFLKVTCQLCHFLISN